MDFNTESSRNSERKALYASQDHTRKVISAIKELSLLIEDWINGNTDKLESRISYISTLEKDANNIKWTLLDELSKNTTLFQREDLMRLVMSVDKIADAAEGVAAQISSLTDLRPADEIADEIKRLSEALLKSGDLLRESIFMLTQNLEKATELTKKVDLAEEEVDSLQRDLLIKINNHVDDVKCLLRFQSLIRKIEETADQVKDSADAVRILTMALHM
ncbi:MAG: DUF47 domain-containing protein [Candidatus Odinarchaeia archaeon]